MFKFILPIILAVMLSGCSLLPRITFDKPGVTPTQTQKSSKKETCSGEYKVDPHGVMIYCSKGYQNSESNYSQKERVFTLQERIANFVRGLTGWGFWIFIALLLFCPGAIGGILSFLIDRLFGAGKVLVNGLTETIGGLARAKQKVKDSGDPNLQKAMDIILDELSQAHSKDKKVQDLINKMRSDVKFN